MIRILLFGLCLVSSAGSAAPLPTLYRKTQIQFFEAQDPQKNLQVWNGPNEIEGFLLDEKGAIYKVGSGLRMLTGPGGEAVVGVKQGDKIFALLADTLSPEKSLAPVLTPAGLPFRGLDSAAKPGDVLKVVQDFHSNFCEKQRASAVSVLDHMLALKSEWQKFVESKSTAERETASLAMAVDFMARTAVFESAKIGVRDGKTDFHECRDASQCPVQVCEMQVIALTVKNRARTFTSSRYEAIVDAALGEVSRESDVVFKSPSRFDSWNPGNANPMITTCLYRNGLTGLLDGAEGLEGGTLLYPLALEAAVQVMNQNPAKIFSASDVYGKSARPALERVTQYYQPAQLETCESKGNMRANGAVYICMDPNAGGICQDYALLFNAWVKAGTEKKVVETTYHPIQVRKLASAENAHYIWGSYSTKGQWYIAATDVRAPATETACIAGGPYRGNGSSLGCADDPHSKTKVQMPGWATALKPSEKLRITCENLPGKPSLGGPCDWSVQWIASGQ